MLEAMLRGLVIERSAIRHGMAWCIQRSAASDEIVETLAGSLTLLQTPVPKKIARLFLVSDILHNAGVSKAVPRADSYKVRLQLALPDIFA